MAQTSKSKHKTPGIVSQKQPPSKAVSPPIAPKPSASKSILQTFFFHFRPRRVAEATLAFNLSWGLGGMAAVLVVLQFGTGLLLKFVYEPTPTGAYISIVTFQNALVFGKLVRNLHFWGANVLVLIGFLHLLRVFFTSGYQWPRRMNWIIGLSLFVLVLAANFTGYLLPYDQLGYWAVTVSTAMLGYIPLAGIYLQEILRGGQEMGASSLKIFFALHTAVVPSLLIILMAYHFWRVRKAGGLVIPRRPDQKRNGKPRLVPAVPFLLLRETSMALAITAVVLLLAVFFNAPLADPANPGLSPNPTKAPWYFAGLQELLVHFHPTYAVFVIPLCAFLFLLYLPFAPYPADARGVWFVSRLGRRTGFIAVLAAALITTLAIVVDDLIWQPNQWLHTLPAGIGNGLLPFILGVGLLFGFYGVLRRRWGASNHEALQAVFILLVTGLVVLTITGVWFRGKGMALTLPF
jgi:quinol-cytochrome oxidoreductase complex cytochrome b subunit